MRRTARSDVALALGLGALWLLCLGLHLELLVAGRVAWLPGMFSQAGTIATTFALSFSSATLAIVPMTAAAPHMSNFISSIFGGGFSEMPPVSNVMPLPQSTIGCALASAPLY